MPWTSPPENSGSDSKEPARAIKVALLDQRAVAGVGNLYASEILHRRRSPPRDSVQPPARRVD